MEHYVKNFPLPPIQKFPRHEEVGPSEKASLGGQNRRIGKLEKEKYIKVVVVVALLFYVHGKHLRSCRDGQ